MLSYSTLQSWLDAIDKLDQSTFSRLVNFEELAGRNASWAYLEREAAAFE